jgi:hypothetical protein
MKFGYVRAQPALECGSEAAAFLSEDRSSVGYLPVGEGGSCATAQSNERAAARACRANARRYAKTKRSPNDGGIEPKAA